ncbi:DUF3618 domain-containing protein [Streptomyces sp. NPDC056580]|uniref:DUF3618 domain-containing protein n=1 Tax=Streptomyces sp. NPDC056580 TaxID=3345872 RepID=UPI0036766530
MTQPPHDEPTAESPDELREQVENTRRELGDTVEALAAKADVKARTKEKAAEVKDQAAVKAGELKERAALKAGQARAAAAQAVSRVQEKLPDPVREQAAQVAGQAGQVWEEKVPEPVRARTAQGARMARDNRGLVLAAAGAVTVLWLMCRRKG